MCFWQNESSSDTALQCEMFRFFDTSFEDSVLNVTLLENSDFDTYTEVENYEKNHNRKVEVVLFLV